MVTASLEIYPTKQIKKTIDTSISELSLNNVSYDYLPVPVVTVVYPNGGEVFFKDQTANILWNISDYRASVNSAIWYSDNNGQDWTILVENIPTVPANPPTPNQGIYPWDLSTVNESGSNFLVKVISDVYGTANTVEADSSATFTVQQRLFPSITNCSLHGIYPYLEQQLAIIGIIGGAYELKSYISHVDGDVGKVYHNILPYLNVLNGQTVFGKYYSQPTGSGELV